MSKSTDKLRQLINELIENHFAVNSLERRVMELIELEADVTITSNSQTLLHCLVSGYFFDENINAMALLLEFNQALVTLKNQSNQTPLQSLMNKRLGPCAYDKAVYFANFKKAAMLLAKHGADLSVLDTALNSENTLFHHLVLCNQDEENNGELIELVSLDKACIDYRNKDYRTPLQALMNQFSVKAFKPTAILLVRNGACLSVKDNSYLANTLLHHLVLANDNAIDDGNINQMLATNKELVFLKNGHGQTALQYLIHSKSNLEVLSVEPLLAFGSDLFTKDNLGRTLLHSAVLSGNLKVAKYLVKQGLDPFERTKQGKTLLHCSKGHSTATIWDWLVSQGLNINAQDHLGNTLLHQAIDEKNTNLIQWLLAHHAQVDVKNNKNETPLDCAGVDEKILTLLLNGPHKKKSTRYFPSFFSSIAYYTCDEQIEDCKSMDKSVNIE